MRAYERMLEYVKYPTASDPESTVVPSTQTQWDLARALVKEMKEMGISNVSLDEHCYVMGEIPSNIEGYNGPSVGFVAHMDVSCEAPAENIKAQVIEYNGGDIIQNEELDLRIDVNTFPFIEKYKGCHIVTSDGTTLLGADNKAGIAEILTMAETLLNNPEIKHGNIKIAFTPDEEIGCGTEFFDVERFGADFAYTVDGDAFGECQSETFNAFTVNVYVTGFNIHPGSAKNRMKNAIRIAAEYEVMIPDAETPEHTEGYEGFYHLCEMKGDVESAQMEYIIRDHDINEAQRRCEFMKKAADYLNSKYGEGTVRVEITPSYRNMREVIEEKPQVVELVLAVYEEMGVSPDTAPIRGGTDGANLSFMGVPCPNLGTGGHNYHGRKEFAVVEEMDKVVDLLIRIAEKTAEL